MAIEDDQPSEANRGGDTRLVVLLALLALAGTPIWVGLFLVVRWTVLTAWAGVAL
jgi:hypothetical protein